MKNTIPFLLIITVLAAFSCKKPSDGVAPTPPKDTSEYFTFNIMGGVYHQDSISIDKKREDEAILIYTTKGYVMYLYTTRPTNDKGYLTIDYIGPSQWNYSEYTFQGFSLKDFKNGPEIRSKSGIVTVTHFADSIGDYMTGTFKGDYKNIDKQDTITYQITDGKFRFKRRE